MLGFYEEKGVGAEAVRTHFSPQETCCAGGKGFVWLEFKAIQWLKAQALEGLNPDPTFYQLHETSSKLFSFSHSWLCQRENGILAGPVVWLLHGLTELVSTQGPIQGWYTVSAL